MTARPALAVVIVSWNVRELLRRCLAAVEASLAGSGLDHEVFVVDNGSADGAPAMVRADFPRVRLIESGANLGFAGGNNVALREVLREGRADYVLLLNPDAEPVGDAIPRLVRELEARPELAAVGPMLRYADGSPQPSRRRFPSYWTLFWESTALDRLWPGNPWAARYRCADRPDDVAQPVGWLVGAALLVRAEAIRWGGLLDERFFMYSEELEWQARLQRAWGARAARGQDATPAIGSHREGPREGSALSAPSPSWSHREGSREGSALPEKNSSIWYLPEAVVIHHEGKSSEQAVARRHLSFSRSKVLLARMWHGWGAARLLRAALHLGFAYELAAEGLKLVLGHRPALRRERIRVYWRVIREL